MLAASRWLSRNVHAASTSARADRSWFKDDLSSTETPPVSYSAADMATLQMAKPRELTTFGVEYFHNAVVVLIQSSWQAYPYISNPNPYPMGEVTLNPPPAPAEFRNDKVLPL